MTISIDNAICCLVEAGQTVLAQNALPPVQHAYLDDTMRFPYCDHSAIVVREISATLASPSLDAEPIVDPSRDFVWFDRFEIQILRAGAISPNIEPADPICVGGIYGDCSSDNCNTISGHYNSVMADRRAFRADLMTAWCECMYTKFGQTKSAPTWIETYERRTEGRFGGTLFTVASQLG